jgi:hypothetical protein
MKKRWAIKAGAALLAAMTASLAGSLVAAEQPRLSIEGMRGLEKKRQPAPVREAIVPLRATVARALVFGNWTTKQHNGGTYDTTSNPRDLDREAALGARILKYSDGRYVQTLHKQYPSVCGPASLAMVLKQLGITDAARPASAGPGTVLAKRQWRVPRDVDWQGSEMVDVGYSGSMEHLMWLGYHRHRLGLDMGGWNNSDNSFMAINGVLNTAPSRTAKSFLAEGRDMNYLPFDQIPSWMWQGAAVGTGGSSNYYTGLPGIMNYIYSGARNGPWRDARPLYLHGRNDAEVIAIRRIIKGFIDHSMTVVAGVDSGGHFNTVVGYRGQARPASAPFYVYTADPLNGWGRRDESQPGTWRRTLVSAENLMSGNGVFMALVIWNHHAEGGAAVGFRASGWAAAVDRANGNDWLTGRARQPQPRDPLFDRLGRVAERMP